MTRYKTTEDQKRTLATTADLPRPDPGLDGGGGRQGLGTPQREGDRPAGLEDLYRARTLLRVREREREE